MLPSEPASKSITVSDTLMLLIFLELLCSTQLAITCGALHDLVPCAQFEKRKKHAWRSVTFSSNTPPWVFFTFFKFYESYQIAQSTTHVQS